MLTMNYINHAQHVNEKGKSVESEPVHETHNEKQECCDGIHYKTVHGDVSSEFDLMR
jgi:hypothetical protein